MRSTRRPAGFANYAATVLVDWTPFDGGTSRRRSRADQPDVALIEAEEAVLRRRAGLRSARRQANHVNRAHFDRHRGAYLGRGRCVLFGNEGFTQDPRAQREVALVLKTQGQCPDLVHLQFRQVRRNE